MADDIAYTYTGGHERNGQPSQWHEGIPARNLTQKDVAALDPALLDTLAASSIYEWAGEGKPPEAPQDPEAPALSKLTRDELNAHAAELGIESPESFPNKGDLITAIEAAGAT